jgi:hypothetical protein
MGGDTMSEAWKLADYNVGKSYDERNDDKYRLQKIEIDKIRDSEDFSEFDELTKMYVKTHNDFESAHVEEPDDFALPIDVADVDLTRPPGFVGRVTDWIDGQCRYPRRRLAVASALTAIGNIGGMSHYDTRDGITANLLTFCVAASSTGKEAVMQAFNDLHSAAGVQRGLQGSIKSEQEILRNLIEHQASFYSIDEIGIFLKKIRSAQKSGNAAYLEGVFGAIMSAYSKANSRMLLGGDTSRELRKQFMASLSRAQENDDEDAEAKAMQMLSQVDEGLFRPFMSIMGFTTPSTFDGMMDGETATQGFVGRSIIISERDINPRPRKQFKAADMPIMMTGKLGVIYSGSENRVEYVDNRKDIHTDDEADAALDLITDWLIDYAEHMGEKTGEASVAMIRRAYELIAKVSFILAIPDGVRTLEHVKWAFAFVKDEMDFKVQLVFANDNSKEKPEDALAARLLNFIDTENGLTTAMLANKLRASEDVVRTTCVHLETAGQVKLIAGRKYRGKTVEKWFRVE